MFKKLSQWFMSVTSWKAVLITLVGWQVSVIFVMGHLNDNLKAVSGGVGVLDLRLTYNADQAYEALTAYTSAGRLIMDWKIRTVLS